jgi:hypothetical protein
VLFRVLEKNRFYEICILTRGTQLDHGHTV